MSWRCYPPAIPDVPVTPNSTPPRTLAVLLLAAAFAAAHTQSPLGFSNQNQYFLHALSDIDHGDLRADWLANTRDPTPLFSAGLAVLFQYLGGWSVQLVFFLALMGYFVALWAVVRRAMGPVPLLPWAAAIVVAHAGIVRFASDRLLGADYPWFLHCGLASQYVLGPGLQPSVVGVLLVAAVAAFTHGRVFAAVALAVATNVVHATYLLPSALLVVGFLVAECASGRTRRAMFAGLLGLGLVAPVIAYNLWTFAPTSYVDFPQAQAIVAWVRIPHHTNPVQWFDWVAGLQVLWMVLALVVLRRTCLGLSLAVTLGVAALLTAAVAVTRQPTLALLFPWRVTAVLVPVSTAVLFAWGVKRLTQASGGDKPPEMNPQGSYAPRSPLVAVVSVVLIAASLVGATAVYHFRLGYRDYEAENAALEYVRDHHLPGELYLVPTRFPKPVTARGVYSSTFNRPPAPDAVAFFEMQRFRVFTGAALFIDFKSIPYQDAEVLEWHRRMTRAAGWFARDAWDDAVLDEMQGEGITHVVVPTRREVTSDRLVPLFEGGAYRVYRFRAG